MIPSLDSSVKSCDVFSGTTDQVAKLHANTRSGRSTAPAWIDFGRQKGDMAANLKSIVQLQPAPAAAIEAT